MESLKVFKVGGQVIENKDRLNAFLKDFAAIKGAKILIHGGGKWVSQMSTRLGYEVKMVDGRRITDADTLEVVKMMLAGVANKNIVSGLQAAGCNAIGLTGADANTIRAHKRPLKNGVDFGFVGDVDHVDAQVIHTLLKAGLMPVFAAMTHDGQGNLLNTNADTIASVVATSMSKLYQVELIYCFELPGVMQDINDLNSVIKQIDTASYVKLKQNGVINDGMIPKLDNAFDALKQGVNKVRICMAGDLPGFETMGSGPGTVISI